MSILVLQHIDVEGLGYLENLLRRDGFSLTTVRLDLGEQIPKRLEAFAGMFSMGGPMDTWMEDEFPWLAAEKKAIREFAVELRKPFMGFCLGCQLLGEVLGGKVVQSPMPEVGVFNVHLSEDGRSDRIFAEFPASFKALHWHSWEVAGLESNHDVALLGSSDQVKCQLFRYRERAYGIQFHLEIMDQTVSAWSGVTEYRESLRDSLGEDGVETFTRDLQDNMKDINRGAEILWQGFKALLPN